VDAGGALPDSVRVSHLQHHLVVGQVDLAAVVTVEFVIHGIYSKLGKDVTLAWTLGEPKASRGIRTMGGVWREGGTPEGGTTPALCQFVNSVTNCEKAFDFAFAFALKGINS